MIRDSLSDKIESLFLQYLASLSISQKTLKNYKSDLLHFTGWLILKVRSYGVFAESLADSLPFIKNEVVSEYKNFLTQNHEPAKTINRRLSTLRHLARFLIQAQILDFDFMAGVSNITSSKNIKISQHPIVIEFQKHLESQNVSKNTIKNYLSDIRQFLSWLENQEKDKILDTRY